MTTDFTTPLLAFARPLALLCAVVGALAMPARAHAQTPATPPEVVVSDTLREIRLADGSVLFARVESVEGDRVTLVTQAGVRLQVDRAQIRSVRRARGEVRDGEVWRDDPTGTRLFFAPTGRNLSAGEAYFGVYELFFPFATYGVTDRITVAAGTPIIPGAFGQVAYFAPKLAIIQSERLNVAAGVFAGFFEGETAGIIYGVGTWGGRDNAVTAGAGFGFGGGDLSDQPILMIGGETRTGRQLKLITENYIVPGEDGVLLSGGMRFFGERLSADVGIGAMVSSGGTDGPLPLVNFVYTFGKR
jgi:hypothetical protein